MVIRARDWQRTVVAAVSGERDIKGESRIASPRRLGGCRVGVLVVWRWLVVGFRMKRRKRRKKREEGLSNSGGPKEKKLSQKASRRLLRGLGKA